MPVCRGGATQGPRLFSNASLLWQQVRFPARLHTLVPRLSSFISAHLPPCQSQFKAVCRVGVKQAGYLCQGPAVCTVARGSVGPKA